MTINAPMNDELVSWEKPLSTPCNDLQRKSFPFDIVMQF